jgi:5-formyltetrahydrofolate cyclo-ligase
MDKKEIRKNIKSLRLSLSLEEKNQAASNVFSRLEELNVFQSAEAVLLYYSLPDELPTPEFLKRWSGKKKIYLPRVVGNDLEILPYDENLLNTGAFNIEEPTGDNSVPITDIDLVIVPAVAFDENGYRLGRGKGFYDRLLAGSNVIKIGVGYEFQLLPSLPIEPHDVPMDVIITPKGVLSFI